MRSGRETIPAGSSMFDGVAPVTLSEDSMEKLADLIASKMKVTRSPDVLTRAEVAELLGVSERTVQRREAAGVLQSIPGFPGRFAREQIR